jgi:hypothetical protein
MNGGALSSADRNNPLTWREIVESHSSAMVSVMCDALAERLDSDLRSAVAAAVEEAVAAERTRSETQLAVACVEARASQAESLNQSLRRLRHAADEEHILRELCKSCVPFADLLVVLVFENNQARVVASRGFESGEFSFEIGAAPAVVSAIESRDPVIALGTEAEVSAVLSQRIHAAHGHEVDQNTYLFPLKARHSVVGMLIALGSTPANPPLSAPIEMLCEAAGIRLESLLQPPALPQPIGPPKHSWDSLAPDDQSLHLKAQRMARVKVAEMRIAAAPELREGIATADIYGALRPVIDAARNQFRTSFLEKSRTMVDYLHLEIMRTLAHDEDRLLGPDYPGPLI